MVYNAIQNRKYRNKGESFLTITLNTEQKQAVEFFQGACGVIASAGSGKSLVLLERIRNLVNKHRVQEHDILAISFTNNTAKELRDKLMKMGLYSVNVGTFHATCMDVIKQERGVGVDLSRLVPEWKVETCLQAIDKDVDVPSVKSFIGYQKSYNIRPNDKFKIGNDEWGEIGEAKLRKFYQAYENMKKQQGLIDFDDILLDCLDILRANKGKYTFEYILIDEHQDTNMVQNEILKEWCQSGNMFAAFDGKQAIYAFRGGDPQFALDFEKHWDNAKIINMHVNYRSTKNIIEHTNTFIRDYFNHFKHYKDTTPSKNYDGEITLFESETVMDEAKKVVDEIEVLIKSGTPLDEIAVLYREHVNADFIENELKSREIDYDIANEGSFFKRREVEMVLSYIRLALDRTDDEAAINLMNFRNDPLKFISRQVGAEIQSYALEQNISLFQSMKQYPKLKAWQRRSFDEFTSKVERLALNISLSSTNVSEIITRVYNMFNLEGYIRDKYTSHIDQAERTQSIESLKYFVQNNNLEQFIEYTKNASEKRRSTKNSVKLMTAHGSKGLEFDNVFVVHIRNDIFPHERSERAEEARLFYVATTRAKENLWLSQLGGFSSFVDEFDPDNKLRNKAKGITEESIDQSIEQQMQDFLAQER